MHESLERFVAAQDDGGTYERALTELLFGRKTSHWMWFVLPQLAGLGNSEMSRRYAVRDLGEARAYAAHPVLGPRLVACSHALTGLAGSDPEEVLGPVDAQKLRSSMTLFARADPHQPAYGAVLRQYFDGVPDPRTLELLADPEDEVAAHRPG